MWLSYDTNYNISSDGEVYSKITGKTLKVSCNPQGYKQVSTTDGCKQIHRMLGERFLPRIIRDGDQVDHIDKNKDNNNLSNLRWVSRSLNRRNINHTVNKSLPYKNIYKQVDRPSYRVCITIKGVRIYNKNFNTLEEAITARDDILNSEEYKT
jgi:hypothetical protein